MSKFFNYVSALLVTSLCSVVHGIGQEIDLAADKIPDSLLKKAAAVVRYEKEVFEVTDLDRASYKIHKIVTILNQRANHYLVFQIYGY